MADQKTARSLCYFATEILDFRQGRQVIAALLQIDPELVLGFQYKAGSVPAVKAYAGLDTLTDVRERYSLKGGFPRNVDIAT